MSDDYWSNTRAELRDLVEKLRPEDAREIIRKLVRTDSGEQLAPLLAGLIRGFVGRRDYEQRREREEP